MRVRACLVAGLLGLIAGPADAQTRFNLPSVEFAARVGATATLLGGLPGYGVSVSMPISRRYWLEADANILPRTDTGAWTSRALFYHAGLRGGLLRSHSGIEWFWTAGGSGAFTQSQLSGRKTRYGLGWLVDMRGRTEPQTLPPIMLAAGTGLIVPLGRDITVRAEIRALLTPVGPVGQTALSITARIKQFGSR